jgi:hypothetical protein
MRRFTAVRSTVERESKVRNAKERWSVSVAQIRRISLLFGLLDEIQFERAVSAELRERMRLEFGAGYASASMRPHLLWRLSLSCGSEFSRASPLPQASPHAREFTWHDPSARAATEQGSCSALKQRPRV